MNPNALAEKLHINTNQQIQRQTRNLIAKRVMSKKPRNRPASVAQLVATRDNLCRGRGSNPVFPTSPYIMCVNLATRLLDQKINKAPQPQSLTNETCEMVYESTVNTEGFKNQQ